MGVQSRPSDIYLSTENILSRVSSLDIFKMYISSFKCVDERFQSELRKSDSLSCAIFVWEGSFLYKDFVRGTPMNCFQYVMEKFGFSFHQALLKINHDFGLCLDNGNAPASVASFKTGKVVSEELKRRRKIIEIVPRDWIKRDIQLWKTWGIGLNVLKFYDVSPISKYFTDNIPTNTNITSPAYVYRLFGRFKIYRPLETGSRKWRSNSYKTDIQGWQQLPEKGDLLILTSSLKDVMLLYQLGYNAIALHGESDIPSPVMIEHLKGRFKRIVFFYDNDWNKEENWGQISALKFSGEFGLDNIAIPSQYKSSDPTDLVENVGLDNATIIIQQLLL